MSRRVRDREPPSDMLKHLTLTAITCAAFLVGLTSVADALPRNFRNVDVFYVGGMPDESDVDEMKALGIEQFISLHPLPNDVAEHAESIGMELHSYPLRSRLLHAEAIMELIESAPVGTVFVHCMHGADRTGAVAAYWLHTRRGLDPFLALATVISPSVYHLRGLEALAREYAMTFGVDDRLVGRYSGERNGGLEGLKVRGGRWYTRLARSFLEQTAGDPLREPSRKFWGDETGKF